jgi:hypothetical protein
MHFGAFPSFEHLFSAPVCLAISAWYAQNIAPVCAHMALFIIAEEPPFTGDDMLVCAFSFSHITMRCSLYRKDSLRTIRHLIRLILGAPFCWPFRASAYFYLSPSHLFSAVFVSRFGRCGSGVFLYLGLRFLIFGGPLAGLKHAWLERSFGLLLRGSFARLLNWKFVRCVCLAARLFGGEDFCCWMRCGRLARGNECVMGGLSGHGDVVSRADSGSRLIA